MRKHFLGCGVWLTFLITAPLYSQSAQEVIDIAFKNYAEMTSYSGVLSSRQARVTSNSAPDSETSDYDVQSMRYIQMDAKWRKPGDWLLLRTQTFENKGTGVSSGVRFNAFSRLGDGPAMQNSYLSPKSVAQTIPPASAPHALRNFIFVSSESDSDNLILNQLLGQHDDAEGPSWGILAPEFKADEICQGELCYQITGRMRSSSSVNIWISKSRFLLMRSVTVGPKSLGSRMGSVQMPGARVTRPENDDVPRVASRLIVEMLLTNQEINPMLATSAFALPASGKFDPTIGYRAGFDDFASLVKLIPPSTKSARSEPGSGVGSAQETAASTPTPTPTPTPEPAGNGQLLTPSQMSGIVLIDGNESMGSGFMTKIKGVDFVVTNLHVVGSNKKFTLKTLRGQEVPVLGIFGAVGSDIAILRIEKGEGDLKLADDVFTTAKIGDRVVVVGNRLGGGVATQTPGNIMGIGPTRVEVSANFESGNSGSPIVDLNTKEVIGIATYAETRRIQIDDAPSNSRSRSSPATMVEKRWFGYRVDAVTKWEAIDLAKWNAQGERIDKFRGLSEALVAFLKLDFRTARQHPRLSGILDGFETRYRATGGNSVTAATEVKDLFRVVRTISDDGVRDLSTGEYYDYYRTCLYWENSITSQLEYRKLIIEALKKYEANSSAYVSRMRNGGG